MKQELIDYCNAIKENKSQIINCIDVNGIIKKIEQLDEPEKVKVPQFVAEHIEWTKEEDFHLLGAMNRENFDKKLEDWFYTDDNMELFARAWLDGYTIEEKRYRVKMKDITISTRYLKHNTQSGNWFLSGHEEALPYRTHHTRKELEQANFGWVFDCEGVEVEEVEE